MMRPACGKWVTALVVAAVLTMSGGARGAEFDYANFQGEWGLRFGYGQSIRKASVQLYSLLPRWGIFLLRPGQKLGPLGISFVVEGIVSVASAEETGFEIGFTPMVKFTYVLFPRALIFLEGGAGLISESINSPAIGHAFNFTPQVGAGVDIALAPRWGLTVAYRFRHSSNAGLYNENPAFNCNFFHVGVTYYY
jgi:opacity protein-like surface antigen